MTPLALGLDLGSSALKGVLLTASGTVVSRAEVQVATTYPAADRAEQDPIEWSAAMRSLVPALLSSLPEGGGEIAGIGIAGAAHIPVLLDETLRPLRPAIMWSDQRSAGEATEAGRALDILSVAGNSAGPGWTLPQLMWLSRHEPDVYRRASHLVLGKDYLVFKLTGELVTDQGNAVGSLLLDIVAGQWSSMLCSMAGLPTRALPPIAAPGDIVGRVTGEAAADLGLPIGVPVVAGGLDSVLELLALGIVSPGQAMLRMGTAGGVMAVSDAPHPHPAIINYPHVNGLWCAQAFNSACGSALHWLATQFFPSGVAMGLNADAYGEIEALARRAPPGAEGLVFHPYLLGERAPLWDSDVRASFTGLGMRHNRSHLARAVLEGVACAMRDCCDALTDTGFDIRGLRATGGGTRSMFWLHIVRDILELPVDRMPAEGSALGAAMLAGSATGIFVNLDEAVARCVRGGEPVSADGGAPVSSAAMMARYRHRRDVLQAMYRTDPSVGSVIRSSLQGATG